jgi:hypothetical protein
MAIVNWVEGSGVNGDLHGIDEIFLSDDFL